MRSKLAKKVTDTISRKMFLTERDIDRRKCERVVPMKVLVIGMCRTGTTSEKTRPQGTLMMKADPLGKGMQVALEELGYGPCYHMNHCFRNPMECDMWKEALEAKFYNKGRKYTKKDWDQLLGQCQVRF